MMYTHGDCLKMKYCLVNIFGFLEKDCHLMMDINLNNTNDAITSVAILKKKIIELIELSKPRDTLVIYFSGHNFYNENKRMTFMTAADDILVNDRASLSC